jgi:DNA-binding NarL/FixJ family response regulator
VTGPIRLLLADDHALFRRGLMALLGSIPGFELVGEAIDGKEAIVKAKELNPDVVLMDIEMPNCNGVEAARSIRAEGFSGGILMLTVSDREDDLFAALKAGANGYLLKGSDLEELTFAVGCIARGGTIISPGVAGKLLNEFRTVTDSRHKRDELGSPLSTRETEVLRLVAIGASNREIASQLFISENTVKGHLRTILEKLHFKNRSQAAAYAVGKEITGARER